MPNKSKLQDKSLTSEIIKKIVSGENIRLLMSEYCRVETAKIFLDKEMMDTAYCFFECDLNISKTSRKLFMHRNTLSYRINKILSDTGFDIRVFDEACAFILLYQLYILQGE